MSTDNGESKPAFSIKYLDSSDVEIEASASIEKVETVEIKICVPELINNKDLGTAIVRGFMDERKDEVIRLIQLIRSKRRSDAKVIVPGKGFNPQVLQ